MSLDKIKSMNISNDEYKRYILNTVNELRPSKKKTNFSNEYLITYKISLIYLMMYVDGNLYL